MNNKVRAWRKAGKHYPPILRDFHDTKDLFKLIHTVTKVEDHKECDDISWIKGHCYVVDIFLWCMARYGYTLQKSRARLEFEDLGADLETMKTNMAERFDTIFHVKHTI